MLHGPYGEDGTVQGLLELANVPYVGAGVLGSAVGMDKAVMKTLFVAARPADRPLHRRAATGMGARCERPSLKRVTSELGYPVFVKPANLGSSVGISKAKSDAELATRDGAGAAVRPQDRRRSGGAECARDRMRRARQRRPEASVPGEIIPSREFYDYEAKYLDDGSKAVIPRR